MDQVHELQRIVNLPLFSHLAEANRQRIALLFQEVGERIEAADGEALLRQGGVGADAGFILLRGKVQVLPEDGAPLAVDAPALLGEMSQVNRVAQRTATVLCQGEVDVLKFSWQTLLGRSRETLPETDRLALIESIERQVLERLHEESLIDLPMLRGLSNELRIRICLFLQWETHPLEIADGDRLFEVDGLCGDMGYLLDGGEIELLRPHTPGRRIAAPNVIGIMPRFQPDLRWTATAYARGNVEVRKFSWLSFLRLLQQRLAQDELLQFNRALSENARDHFIH